MCQQGTLQPGRIVHYALQVSFFAAGACSPIPLYLHVFAHRIINILVFPSTNQNLLKCTVKSVEFYRIITVGNQSTGKSTLLEAICGDAISLPKGHGMVTRSPVQLSLRNNAQPGEMSCCMEVRCNQVCFLKVIPKSQHCY